MLTSFPAKNNAANPPVNASGIVNMIINGPFNDWNWATMIRYINASANTSIKITCFMDSITVSFSPLYSIEYPSGRSIWSSVFFTLLETDVVVYPSFTFAETEIYRVWFNRLIDERDCASSTSAISFTLTVLVSSPFLPSISILFTSSNVYVSCSSSFTYTG